MHADFAWEVCCVYIYIGVCVCVCVCVCAYQYSPQNARTNFYFWDPLHNGFYPNRCTQEGLIINFNVCL